MTNLSQLERQWKAYKRKEQRPLILGVSMLLIVVTLGFVFWPAVTMIQTEQPMQAKKELKANVKTVAKAITPLPTITPKQELSEQEPPRQEVSKQQVQELRPSFGFMKHIKEKPAKKETKTYKQQTKKSQKTQSVAKVPPKQVSVQKENHNKVSVSSTSTQNRMKALAKRFNESRNPILGITIAKQYMKAGNYKQAYFYALEVNTIDRNNEESWLVTAQALYFLNKKESAIQVLQNYNKNHSSTKAAKLLRMIKRDQLK